MSRCHLEPVRRAVHRGGRLRVRAVQLGHPRVERLDATHAHPDGPRLELALAPAPAWRRLVGVDVVLLGHVQRAAGALAVVQDEVVVRGGIHAVGRGGGNEPGSERALRQLVRGRTATAHRPQEAVRVARGLVRHLEVRGERRHRLELAERTRRRGVRHVEHLDTGATVHPCERAVGLDERRDVAGTALGATRSTDHGRRDEPRARGNRDVEHIEERTEVSRRPVVHDHERRPAQVDVLVLEVRQRMGRDHDRCRRDGDVEHDETLRTGDERVVASEGHPERGSGRHRAEQLDVRRDRQRRRARIEGSGRRNGDERHREDGEQHEQASGSGVGSHAAPVPTRRSAQSAAESALWFSPLHQRRTPTADSRGM